MKIFRIFLLFMLMYNISMAKLKIGVSMLPYYSFTRNIVKDKADVIQVLPTDVDVHSYQVGVNELKKINELDVLVINGTGIDDYLLKLVKSSNNKNLKIINSSKNVSLLIATGERGSSKNFNTHTFIAANAAIKQVFNIAEELSKIDKENSKEYINNAKSYAKKISLLKNKYSKELNKIKTKVNLNVATTHAGYDYLLNELGIKVSLVIEPRGNSVVSANDLKRGIDIIKKEKIAILFESDGSASPYSKQISRETGIVIKKLSHHTNGKYTDDAFMNDLEKNLKLILEAFKEVKN